MGLFATAVRNEQLWFEPVYQMGSPAVKLWVLFRKEAKRLGITSLVPNRFRVIPVGETPRYEFGVTAYLLSDRWNDWFTYCTQFWLEIHDIKGNRFEIGSVKIGQFGMHKDQVSPALASEFDSLGDSFFSLGQDDSYYENLNRLGQEVRDRVLTALRDLAAHPDLLDTALKEDVTTASLLRYVSLNTVRGQFRRMTQGGARLTRYQFSYEHPRTDQGSSPLSLTFIVEPESNPPSNIHVLMGRNGVGKTHLLNNMTTALLGGAAESKGTGIFRSPDADDTNIRLFSGVVLVTFSAFDPFLQQRLPENKHEPIGYSYIGLRESIGYDSEAPKTLDSLADDFVAGLKECSQGAKRTRWDNAVRNLQSDPVFFEADVSSLFDTDDRGAFEKKVRSLFKRLSSGHKIVLLTITRLVQTVQERTLILMDEPEAHLHPPLLSAFVRALSDLLTDRNGVAILATHSPVVLQEVPRSCAWVLRRSGLITRVERPSIETFGENVGTLTREVFGLEVTQSGFHRLLSQAVEGNDSFDEVMAQFGGQLGAEAQAIVRGLLAVRSGQSEG